MIAYKRLMFGLPLIVLSIFMVAFSAVAEGSNSDVTSTEAEVDGQTKGMTLDGTQWRLLWGKVEGERFAPFANQPITLNFSADQINGNGSCNGFFGGYTIEGDSLTIGKMGATAMACEEELMELEGQFFDALQSANAFSYHIDTLTLSLPNGTLHFRANMPVEKTIFIGAEQVDCQGVGPRKCYLIKDEPNAEWESFYDEIVGFEWQAGFEYELRVRITPVENRPADASSIRYELIEIVNQVPLQSYTGDHSGAFELIKVEKLIQKTLNFIQSTVEAAKQPEEVGPEAAEVTLDGTQWRLLWGEVESERFAPLANQPITLNFTADQINGNSSCNRFFGGYSIEGESLTIAGMGSTRMACEPEVMAVEWQFLNALQSVNGFTNKTDTLTLSLPNGTLDFRANMPVEKTIFIGAEQVDCQGLGPRKCYLIKDDLNAEWEYFYDQIVGFEWQAGIEYELRVRITPVENPPADASSVVYELIEIVSEVLVQS